MTALLAPFRLASGRLLLEQTRLVLGSIRSAFVFIILMTILMYGFLLNTNNAPILHLWLAVTLLSSTNIFRYASRHLSSDITITPPKRIIQTLCVLYFVSGTLWGSLMWIALDFASMAEIILLTTVLAGMASGAVAVVSPALPISVFFILAVMMTSLSKLLLSDEPAFHTLAIVALFYFAALIALALKNSLATRENISLTLKNEELLTKLRAETEKVQEENLKTRVAKQEAEQANIAKSRLLAAVSHDLRQPVHAQGLFLSVLTKTNLDDEQRKIVEHIRAASSATSEMLHTLMDFSRIEAGAIKPKIAPFRLQLLLNKIEKEFIPHADAKQLSYRSPETSLVVNSDQALIEIILRNLVSNAIHYTQHGGVLVGCRKRGSSVILAVYDTGIGINTSEQREVFREFHQLGNPERDRRKGLGLGLAIVSGLAATLNHPLTLRSTPGRGSVFELLLPLSNEEALVEESTTEARPLRYSGSRILLVDDDEAIRIGTQQQLQSWGFECDTAESIEEALNVVRISPPDLVICDYRLRENHTGTEVINQLRQAVNPDLPALLITGDTAADHGLEAETQHIPILHKPIEADELYRHITMALEE